MSAYNLLSDLRQAGVVVKASGSDRLVVDAPKGALTPDLRAALAEHKKELLAILTITGEQHSPESTQQPFEPRAEAPTVARPEVVSSQTNNITFDANPRATPTEAIPTSSESYPPSSLHNSADSIEDKIRSLEQEAARLRAEQEARRAEIEARQRLDNEIKRLEAEAAQIAVDEEARRAERDAVRTAEEERWHAAAAAHKKGTEDSELREAEEQRRAAQLEARRHAEEEIARRRSEEEIRKVEEQLTSLRADEVSRRAEVTARWQAEDERWQSEVESRRSSEEQASRIHAEAERQKLEAEAKHQADEQSAKANAEAKAKSISEEIARLRTEQEGQQAAEARRKAEKEANRRAAEEARLRDEEEARRKAAEDEARIKAAEETRRKAEQIAQLEAEENARKADQEARLRALEDERSQLEEQSRLQKEAEASRHAEPEWFHVNVDETEKAQEDTAGQATPLSLPGAESTWQAESEGTFIEYEEFESNLQLHSTANFPSGKSGSKELDMLDEEPPVAIAEEPASGVPNATLSLLGSADIADRCAAVSALAQLGGEDAFGHISAAFDDPAVEVRNAAARAMFSFQADRAATFTRALREGTPERRRRIGAALASSGLAAEAVSNLTGESREKTYDAFSLLFLMSKAGEVQPLLRAIEEHSNIEVRLAVVKLLALSGQHEILPAFRRLAVRGSLPPEVRSSVMEAIYQISSQGTANAPSAA